MSHWQIHLRQSAGLLDIWVFLLPAVWLISFLMSMCPVHLHQPPLLGDGDRRGRDAAALGLSEDRLSCCLKRFTFIMGNKWKVEVVGR